MDFLSLHPAEQLAAMMTRIYELSMTTTSGGNLSVMDDEGNIWITPSGIDKGSLTAKDIVCVHPYGVQEGCHIPSCELPFHTALYRSRPDIRAIVHAHPPAMVAYAIADKLPDETLLPDAAVRCRNIGKAGYAVPGSLKLGDMIREQFVPGVSAVMMRNHGVVCGGKNLVDAFQTLEAAEHLAAISLNAAELGGAKHSDSPAEAHSALYAADVESTEQTCGTDDTALREKLVYFSDRCCRQRLFSTMAGTFSARISETDFLVTPKNADLYMLKPEELLRIHCGKVVGEGTPAADPALLQELYQANPDVNAIAIAAPDNIMAFAMSDAVFNVDYLPESFIMLRNVLKKPLGALTQNPAATAAMMDLKHPVAIERNGCVLVLGTDLLNAYDRLEVLEASAKSEILGRRLGKMLSITPEERKEIEVIYHL